MSDTPGLDRLKVLARHFSQLMDDPQPGLVTWRTEFSKVAWEIGNYSGKPNYMDGRDQSSVEAK